MIIHIVDAKTVELRDPDNFKSFKVTLADPPPNAGEIAAALSGIATIETDGRTVWVSAEALKNWGGEKQSDAWIASFDAMVESVRKYGWINEANGAVRAHIEGL